jgi:hypothetical protein
LIVELDYLATQASVQISNLFANEATGEEGRWQALRDGEVVAEGVIDTETGDKLTVEINVEGGFDTLVFSALPYDDPSQRPSDSSDYYVSSITVDGFICPVNGDGGGPVDSRPALVDEMGLPTNDESLLTGFARVTVDFGEDLPGDLPGGAPVPGDVTLTTQGLDGQLTSGGVPVEFSSVNGLPVGRAAGELILVITPRQGEVEDDMSQATYTFEVDLYGPVDHPVAGARDVLTLTDVTFLVEDIGGGSFEASFDVDIKDDVPGEISPEALSAQAGAGPVSGDLGFDGDYGGDGPGALRFDIVDGEAAQTAGGEAILAEGEPVYLFTQPDGSVIGSTDASGDDAAAVVFRASRDEEADQWTLDVFAPLSADDGETVEIALPVIAVDNDGDSADATLEGSIDAAETGNPGNSKAAGKAGESPNGDDFGDGETGKGDLNGGGQGQNGGQGQGGGEGGTGLSALEKPLAVAMSVDGLNADASQDDGADLSLSALVEDGEVDLSGLLGEPETAGSAQGLQGGGSVPPADALGQDEVLALMIGL